MKRLAILLCLLTVVVCGQEPVDILFLIDGSKSIENSDAEDFRKDAIRAFLDFTQDEGGGRVGLLQFAGWNETTEQRLQLIPFTEVPTDRRLRDALLESWRDTIDNELEPFGYATDFNVCLGRGLRGVLDARKREGRSNKLWVILFTDGKMDVEEDGSAAQRYLDAAQERFGRASLDNCNEAAKQLLEEEVFPLLQDESVFLTPIWLRWSAGEQSNPFLEKIAAAAKDAPLLTVEKQSLRNVFLKAFDDLPPEMTRGWISRGLGYQSQNNPTGQKLQVPFRIYEGAKLTKLVCQATTRDYAVDVLDGDGRSILSSVAVRGTGMLYRVLDLVGQAPGAYRLVLENRSGSDAGFESIVFYRFAFETRLSHTHGDTPIHPGDEVTLRLEVRSEGALLSDPDLLAGMQAELGFETPDGASTQQVVFSSAGGIDIPYLVPPRATTGGYSVEAEVHAIKDRKGRWVYSSEPQRLDFQVLPLIEYSLTSAVGYVGGRVRVELEAVKGVLPAALTEIVIETPAGPQTLALEHVGKLAWAALEIPETGAYSVVAPSVEGVYQPGAHPSLDGRIRQIKVMDIKGGPALEEIGVPLLHREIHKQSVRLFIEVEQLEGERGSLTLGVEGASDDYRMSLEHEQLTVAGGDSLQTLLAVDVLTANRLPEFWLGSLQLQLQMEDCAPQERSLEIVPVIDRPNWWMENLWWWLPLLLLLLLLLLLWLLRPQWQRQQVVAMRSGFLAKKGELMIEHKYGLRGNKARGLPELPEGVRFAQGGIGKSHGKTSMLLPKGVAAFVEGKAADRKHLLKHGDLIEFGEFKCRFFEQDPTAGERERYEDDEFVIDDDEEEVEVPSAEIDDDEEFVIDDDED